MASRPTLSNLLLARRITRNWAMSPQKTDVNQRYEIKSSSVRIVPSNGVPLTNVLDRIGTQRMRRRIAPVNYLYSCSFASNIRTNKTFLYSAGSKQPIEATRTLARNYLTVPVTNNNTDAALRKLRRKHLAEGDIREQRKRQGMLKPSVKRQLVGLLLHTY